MYAPPQYGRLAYIKLVKHLAANEYIPTGNTPDQFRQITRPATFNLVVNNSGVKVAGKTHANHLFNSIKKNYDVKIYRNGKNSMPFI